MLDLTSKIVRNNDRFLSSVLENEIVMMDTLNGTYIGLNDVSTTIWNHLENELTAEDLVIRLLEDYHVNRTECELQTLECLNKMEAQGIISLV